MPDNVSHWLEQLGLGQYSKAFEENAIELDQLPKLSDDDLKEIGVKALGHRKRMLESAETEVADRSLQTSTVTTTSSRGRGEAERRQLTIMFCDLVGSTELSQQLDPEDLREINRAYQDACKTAIERYEGYVARYMGDGVLAYFGYPQAHEDDAERAIHAGLGVVESVAALCDEKMELAVRVGIATGHVVVGDLIGEGASQESAVVGETPNLAARLQALATNNTVVIGPGTHDLTRERFEYEDLGEQTLKGIAEPVRAWRVKVKRDQGNRFEIVHAGHISPMVGRDEELEIIYRRWQRAAEDEGQVVLISGEAGIGKSRLSRGIQERISNQSQTTLSYQCSPFHVNSALHPIISHLERGAKFTGSDSNAQKLDKLETLMGAAGRANHNVMALFASLLSLSAEDRYGPLVGTASQLKDWTLAALLGRVEQLASAQCILMVFEDIHWIDPTTLELLDLLVNQVVDARVLVILTHRPEFEGTWVGEAHVTTITLNKLAPRNCTSLVSSITGGRVLPNNVLEEIVEKTNGVPLFIEELTKTIIESGMLRAEDERFVLEHPLVSLAIPATLRDSLMARLDRLAAAKDIAQIGAVIGREFNHDLIREVAGISDDELNAALKKLSDAGLVFKHGSPPHANYVFKHALVQDIAYQSLLKSRRQQLHGKIAVTLEKRFPTLVEHQPELAAHHFFEAGLAERAVEYWRQAGLLASKRSAVIEAVSHLSSAIAALELLPESDEIRRRKLDLLVAKITPVIGAKGYSSVEMEELHNEAVALCEVIGDTPQIFPVLYANWVQTYTGGQIGSAVERAEQLLSQATKQNAEFPTIIGRRVLGTSLVMIGKPHAALKHLEELDAVLDRDVSDRIGFVYGQDTLAAAHCYRSFGLCALGRFESGFSYATASMYRAEEADNTLSRGYVYGHLGILYSMMRETAKLTACLQRLEIHLKETPMPMWDAVKIYLKGVLAFQTEQYEQAESAITEAMITFDTIRLGLWRPIFLGFLAETRLAQGDVDSTRRLLDESIAVIEKGGDPWAHADAYRIKAMVAAYDGARATEITAIYRMGLDLAREQSNKIFELRVGLDLARHLHETGDTAEATRLVGSMYASLPDPGESCLAAQCMSVLRQLRVGPI